MVLLIDERTYSNKCSLDILAQHADLIALSRNLASSEEYEQSVEEISKTIYVHQHEFAALSINEQNGFHLIGSDNATTCHILVLDNHAAVALAHLDGGETRSSIENMLKELDKYEPQKTNFDAYIVGGFIDDLQKKYSKKLSNEVLNILSTMRNVSFHLKLAAITPYNDHIVDKIHYPMIYGICFDVRTKNIRKMSFINNGPAFRLRTVCQSMNSGPAWCIYSSLDGKVIIKKFDINKNSVERYYKPLYQYYFHDDQMLLSMTSTSPTQERASYLTNMKKTVLYILKYYKELPDWFDKTTNSIIYYWLDNKWTTENKKIIEDVTIE